MHWIRQVTSHKFLNINDQSQIEDYFELKKKWELIQTDKTNRIILRSKAKFVEEGEKSTKYFLNLEKRNFENKHMKAIINSEGRMINNSEGILKEQASFYHKLYTSNKNMTDDTNHIEQTFQANQNIPKLNEEQKAELTEALTITELSSA